jgi:hypothetical protein
MVMAGQDEGPEFRRRATPISHQMWTVVEKLAACVPPLTRWPKHSKWMNLTDTIIFAAIRADLFLDFEVSFDGTRITLLVGAPFETLVMEADQTRLQMRMQETKGQLPFNKGSKFHIAVICTLQLRPVITV